MLKITKQTKNQEITFDEFLKLKKDGGYHENLRSLAKAVNFGLLFGMSAATFAKTRLETTWSDEEASQYIKDYGLEARQKDLIAKNPSEPLKLINCKVAAEDISNKFFDTYKGLAHRIKREHDFARKNGYVRTAFGAARRTPQLYLTEYINDYPHKESSAAYGGILAGIKNITSNTAIQNLEACIVMSAIVETNTKLRERNMKSYIFNSVHDSIDAIVHRDEVEEYSSILKEACEKQLDLFFGMPLEIDIDISDPYTNSKEYYKYGRDYRDWIKEQKKD